MDVPRARIRLLALDLDGTLFGDDLLIPTRTREAISEAQRRGVTVAIATGRMFRSAQLIAGDLGIQGPAICYQGALVRDTASGETLLHETVVPALAHELLDFAAPESHHVNIYLGDELFVGERNEHADFYARINLGLPITEVGDVHAWLETRAPEEPTKLVIVTEPAETDHVLALARARFGEQLQVTKSHARFTEFTNRTCSKGRALAALAKRYGVARQEVMAIGDGLNDLDMIAWAGVGVAMAGSVAEVRAAARVVCPPLVEEGAAWAIERFVTANSH